MAYTYTYLSVAQGLIKTYNPPQPFQLHLKKYFSANKKHGGRDRKIISALCYGFFRLGKNFENDGYETRILLGFLVCHPELVNNDWLQSASEKWPFIDETFVAAGLQDKLNRLETNTDFDTKKLFPFADKLTHLADKKEFLQAMLQRPLVWLRCWQGKREKVEELLAQHTIGFENHPQQPNAIGLPQQTNIEQVLGNNYQRFAEVQDASSQLTGNFIELKPFDKVWDCCCGAGGKSLMLKDKEPKIELYSSDIRPQILQNLKERFKLAGLQAPFAAVKDISMAGMAAVEFENKTEFKTVKQNYFDSIIADIPCSGSGTWARTPEQAYYFTAEQVGSFAAKQRAIIINALPLLKKGGRLYYITCSVYSDENEGHLPFFEQHGLKTISHHILEGAKNKADTMFIACLEKRD